ncbi:ATP-binding cassette domain-containing protein [Bombilactobacillus folatiphilus]|uniref:ATP-binding cassette domain-containing protein n=1 Tax=Bombilactobacillus folatiphilus TaxID=2923362 RepID=A0ABY4P9K6_9LACO|nr:ABC-F family ATP-binding cassette domain-containing protein [Bombilactobacillus folatiphilus]UQS82415.1 ATP-binding cassette domain-containing protein [Bombilactobacillus folatiphilus]
MSIVRVEHLSQQFLDKTLYDDANFQVNDHDHLGIIGQNGVGKSTLINILTGQLVPDSGKVLWKKKVKVGYLDQYANLKPGQTIKEFLQTAFQELLDQAQQLEEIYTTLAQDTSEDLLEKAGELQGSLETRGYYEIDAKVAEVAQGLGLDVLGYEHDVAQLSGGQRSKLILAKLLLEQPDILLLDEPTNYLDQRHIAWLADYLQHFEGAFVVVSHDYQFLNQVVNVVCDIELGKLTLYTGNLQQALRQKQADQRTYLKAYASQQKKIAKTQAYIQKNKAGSRSKSARSREKQLARMDQLTPPAQKHLAHFNFPYVDNKNHIILEANDLLIGYQAPLLSQKMNFSLAMGEKVVIKGFNGIGKTTLLKTIQGLLPPIAGEVSCVPTIQMAYYEQNLNWSSPMAEPLTILQQQFSAQAPKDLRRTLAQTGLTQQQVTSPIKTLSGGEQVKVKLAQLMLQPANVLFLDEPTNHLDDDTKLALRQALVDYPGTVVLITHETDFYDSSWIDKVLDIEDNLH